MVFTGHHIYRLLAALCVLLALLFAWQLYHRWDWGALLFLGVAAWSAVRCVILMSSKVEMDEDRVRVLAPGTSPREVEFRQLAAVYEEGRGLQSILLLYNPRGENGLIESGDQRSLSLPAVNGHEQLFAALSAQVKK